MPVTKTGFFGLLMATSVAIVLFAPPLGAARADNPLNVGDYRGKVLLVDFWASWCVPCRRSFPWMNQMQAKYGDEGLVIIGINMDSDSADADAFLRDYPANFRILSDPAGELAREFDVVAMPSSYVIGRDGNLVARHLGFKVKQQGEYEDLLVQTLNAARETD